MSTTSLFVEIVIAGVQAALWVLLLLLTAGADLKPALDFLVKYKDYSALITTVALSLIYVLGIVVDRVADSFCNCLLYSKAERERARGIGKTRLRILHASESMAKFLDYQRSRIRIARATVFNLIVLHVLGLFWILNHRENLPSFVIPSYGAGIVGLALSIIAVRRIDKAHQHRLEDAIQVIREAGGDSMSRPVVAAICYRRKDNEIEFLLVRTKGGKYWTFPKGHVEKDPPEKPWDAAKREAREESGAIGVIETRPLTSYAYSKGKEGKEDVSAYLMAVESQVSPLEPNRDPQWFLPERAIEKLAAGGRKPKYARELERVVSEAVARLQH